MSALLEVEELEVTFGGRTAAVRGASFRVEKGETHCLVGESGCGKSVTALAVMSLLARGGQRSAKRMSFAGTDLTVAVGPRDGAPARQSHVDDLPGADDEPQPGLHDRLADGGGADAPQGRLARGGAGPRRSN